MRSGSTSGIPGDLSHSVFGEDRYFWWATCLLADLSHVLFYLSIAAKQITLNISSSRQQKFISEFSLGFSRFKNMAVAERRVSRHLGIRGLGPQPPEACTGPQDPFTWVVAGDFPASRGLRAAPVGSSPRGPPQSS